MKRITFWKSLFLLCALIVGSSSAWADEVEVEKTINELASANGWTVSSGNTINDIITSFALDDNITISTSGDANCGTIWGSSTKDWRLYQNKSGDVTVTGGEGVTLKSVTFTYSQGNSGTLKDGSTTVASGSTQTLSGTTKTFTVGNTGTGTNGQVKITKIKVVYEVSSGGSGNFTWDLSKKTYDEIIDADIVTWSSNYATMTNSSKSGGTKASNYLGGDSNSRTSSRFYGGNTLTITPKSGYAITSLVFTAASNSYATALKNSTWANATAAADEATVTVTPTNGALPISATIGGTCGFTAVKVFYKQTATITLNAACTDGSLVYGTYSNSKAFVVPGDIIVSEISVEDGKLYVEYYDENDIVPANTGVMVAALEGGNYTVYLTDEAGTSVLGNDNMLKPTGDGITADAMAAAAPGCTYYRLTMHNGTQIGYWWGANSGAAFAVVANKAYLAVPPSAVGAKVSGFAFEDTTTGIANLNVGANDSFDVNAPMYNLAGQRVTKAYKGVVIVNGKKMLNK